MGKQAAPPAPDFRGAAEAQGQANVESARAGAKLSNPNINTPYGNRTVTYGSPIENPATGAVPGGELQALQSTNPDVPTITDTLSPGQQKIFDNQEQLQQQLGFLGIKAADIAGGTLTSPLNFNERFGTQSQGRQEVIDAMMGRYDQDAARQKDSINSDLVARGIPSGSKAYETEMDRLGRSRNDALQQSTIAADQKSMEERRQAITEALAERQIPLNEISAFRTGSQIQPLQFQPYAGQNVAPAPVFGATGAQYQASMDAANLQAAQKGGLMNGLFGLGQAGILSGMR